MTLAEAEYFFKRFNGEKYHMFHDEPGVYKEYKQLQISKEQENSWRLQKVDEYHERIQSDNERAWIWVGNIIKIMHALENVSDELLERLLDALMYISKLSVCQRILVMEHMEGRNDNKCSRSGYALYKSKNKYYEQLQKTMAQIMQMNAEDMDEIDMLSANGEIGWNDAYNRYLRALSRCEQMEKRILNGECLEYKREEKYDYIKKWLK